MNRKAAGLNGSAATILIPKVVVWPERLYRRPHELMRDRYYGTFSITCAARDQTVGMIIFWTNHHHTGIYMKDYSDE